MYRSFFWRLFLLAGIASSALRPDTGYSSWDRMLCQAGYTRLDNGNFAPSWETGSLEQRKPYVALGLSGGLYLPGTPLEDFARGQAKRLKHQVVTYWDFAEKGLIAGRQSSTTRKVEQALARAVKLSPGQKPILFNMDDFRFEHVLAPEWGPRPDNITEQEFRLILGRKEFFEATSWWRDGRELSAEEVCAMFQALPEVCRGEWDELSRKGFGETSAY